MSSPNVHTRTRELGWWTGVTVGSATNTSGSGLGHGSQGNIPSGASFTTAPVQLAHALLGGAAVFTKGGAFAGALEPTRPVSGTMDTHAIYIEVAVHLRSAGDVDLPGQVRFFFNDLWPTFAQVPTPPGLAPPDLGDWQSNFWQEWEDWSPLTVPTPPPGFSTGLATGVRYEYRRSLGKAPANFFFAQLTNVGSVAATEWGLCLYVRNQPPAWTR